MKPIAGVLILGLWLADLAHLYLGCSLWPAAGLAWSAALLLGPRLDAAVRRQCFVLYLAALLLLALAWSQGAQLAAATGALRGATPLPTLLNLIEPPVNRDSPFSLPSAAVA